MNSKPLTKRQVESVLGPRPAQATWNKNTRALIHKTLREGTTRVESPDPFHPEDRGRIIVAPELERRMSHRAYAGRFNLTREIMFVDEAARCDQYRAYLQFKALPNLKFSNRKDAARTERELIMVHCLAVLKSKTSRPLVSLLKQSCDMGGRISWQRCQDGNNRLVKAGYLAQHQVNGSYAYQIVIPVEFYSVPDDFDPLKAIQEINNALSDSVGNDFNVERIEKYRAQQAQWNAARTEWKQQKVAAITESEQQRLDWAKNEQAELRRSIVKTEEGRVSLEMTSFDELMEVVGTQTAFEMADREAEILAEQPVKELVVVCQSGVPVSINGRNVSKEDLVMTYPTNQVSTYRSQPTCERCFDSGYVPDWANGLSAEFGEPGKKPCPNCSPTKKIACPRPKDFRRLGDGAYAAYMQACELWKQQNPDISIVTGKELK